MLPVEAKRILDAVKRYGDFGDRIERISKALLGRPYLENPLGGGPGETETLGLSLAGFDCVTYLETVLGLAIAKSPSDFIPTLRRLRYQNGRVDWTSRNHYMTKWARNNSRLLINLTRGVDSVKKSRALGVVSGIRPVNVTFSVFPKSAFGRVGKRIQTGDVILFAATKKRLDVFHTGLLLRRDGEILMRHASRKAGSVIEQPLSRFLSEHRMSGFILLRPIIPAKVKPQRSAISSSGKTEGTNAGLKRF